MDDLRLLERGLIGGWLVGFRQPREAMTERMLRAISNPLVNTLNHPHGRKINRRPGYEVDMQAVVERAARRIRCSRAPTVAGNAVRMLYHRWMKARAPRCLRPIGYCWFHVQDFRFREGPLDGRMFLYLSALNPKMVGLAARVADGLITNWFTEESYEEYAGIVQQEAEAVGRAPDEVKLFTLTMMAGEDDASVEAMRRGLAFYFASPHYHHIAEISGYGAQARQVQAAWQSRDLAGASRLVTDAMVEKFAVMGSQEQRCNKLRWMMDRNVYPIMYPIPRPGHTIDDHFLVIELVARYLNAGQAQP